MQLYTTALDCGIQVSFLDLRDKLSGSSGSSAQAIDIPIHEGVMGGELCTPRPTHAPKNAPLEKVVILT